MLDKAKCAIRNIIRKKGRSILTIVGIAIGVTSVIIISTISTCGAESLSKEFDSLGLGGLIISTDISSVDSKSKLAENELQAIKKMQNVKEVTPIIMKNTEIFSKEGSKEALVWGIDSRANQIVSLNTVYGRSIDNSDVKKGSNVCMVDQNFSKLMYGRDNIIGKKVPLLISGIKEDFEVIGVIKTGSGLLQNIMGEYIPNFIYIPYTTMQNLAGIGNFDQIAVKLKENVDVDSIGKNIINKLKKLNGSSGSYKANNLARQRQGLLNLMDIVTIILSAVGGISLVVASLSIMTVMLVSVSERTREIGIKKSIGAKQIDIMIEFLLEALFLSVIGCLIGLFIGGLISYIGAFIFGITLKIRQDIIWISFLFSIFSGTIFGVYPAAKASRLQPVEALKFN